MEQSTSGILLEVLFSEEYPVRNPIVATLLSCQVFADKVDALNVETRKGELVDFLEKFKNTMHTGDSKSGVPRLDPYVRSEPVDVNLQDPIKLRGKLSNISAVGLSNYVVKKGDFSKNQLTANVSLLWDNIAIRTNYNASGETLDGAGIWGKGVVALVVRNLKVTVNTKLVQKNGKMAVSSLSSHLHLDKFYFKITGFLDSEKESNKLTAKITNSAPQWIETHQKQVSQISNRFISNMLNKYLGHFTLNEILKEIQA
nr:PREDICTED: uncharacterized protein LOC100883975 isoform X2 [Megachile rotundata]